MRSTFLKAISRTAALAGVGILLTAGLSSAADIHVYLQAEGFTKSLPDGAGGMTVSAQMWGFRSCDSTFTTCDTIDSPGPPINLATADTLTIHLRNTLSSPVSIVIPGQAEDGGVAPVFLPPDTWARNRVQSFTHEVAPSATDTYTWGFSAPLRPGTFLYQSGTQPSIQVPMGLYGALVVGPVPGVVCPSGQAAYDTDKSCYDNGAVLLISEIDVLQNRRVSEAAAIPLGTPDQTCQTLADWVDTSLTTTDYPCTVDYTPTYFLVNGGAGATIPAGNPGDKILLRFLNAGLRSHTPALAGLEMGMVAEDGNPYPGITRHEGKLFLPAGKTSDVLVSATDNATFALFDQMPTGTGNLDSTDPSLPAGGLMAQVVVGTGTPAPSPALLFAVDDVFPVTEDTPLVENVLTNDTTLPGATAEAVVGPQHGLLYCGVPATPGLCLDGSFTYDPDPDFSGADGFTYSATLAGIMYPAQVTLNVSFANDPPEVNDDGTYVNAIGTGIAVDAAHGVLGNDGDSDGDTLTALLDSGPANGIVECVAPPAPTVPGLCADGSFTYTPNLGYTGPDSFMYHAHDGTVPSAGSATVSLTIYPVANITLNVLGSDNASVTNYRWLVEEDATFHNDPTALPNPWDSLSTNFHTSYMPVVAQGCVVFDPADEGECNNVPVADFNLLALDPAKHYYVSVLPNSAGSGEGHTIGGTQIPPGTTEVTVIVNAQPIPTAQISVLVFEDISPTNGAPDPNETRLGGWEIRIEDAGGRYGISGGAMGQDAFGNPLQNSLDCFGGTPPPMGIILSCPVNATTLADGTAGTALIKNLPPGKYGVFAVPPAGTGPWTQTSTIEGTKVVDAWVAANEPPYFVEFGFPSFHVFCGFVNPNSLTVPGGPGPYTVSGNVTMIHSARPPGMAEFDSGSYDALAHTRAWIGVNANAGSGPNIATVPAEPDGSFSLSGIPSGTHQLVIWDTYLDQIISYQTVIVTDSDVNVGNIAVPPWFGRHEHNVFLDDGCGPGGAGIAGNGIREACEAGIPEQVVNLRFRDGSVYQSFPTDTEGFVPFDQIFPFASWQIAEVDYTRFQATGVTFTVDGGGDVSGGLYPGLLNPQVGSPHTFQEPEPFLLLGFQSQPGQTSLFDWGKAPYPPGVNGGISGIVSYSSTRGENEPRLTAFDPWEPAIPRVKVRLYREVERNPALGGGTAYVFVEEVETDSWDVSQPTGCLGEDPTDIFVTATLNGDATRCFDGFRNFEQIRPGVFDGGYAFTGIPNGRYIVEVVPPPGYELYKEEDVNVGFGEAFDMAPAAVLIGPIVLAIVPDPATILALQAAEPGIAQPPCVGEMRVVPPYLSLFPSVMEPAPFAGALRPLCNRKEVILSDQGQVGVAEFHLFTSVPVAGHFQGLVTDDIAIQFDPAKPTFADKYGVPTIPYTQRDYQGHVVYEGYSDFDGRYNGVVASTYSANIPIPSGYSPAMYSVCLNDPKPTVGPGGMIMFDPYRNPSYGTFCYTLQYMPGTTTYLDTPALPQAAFAAGFNPADCAFPDGTPVITQVNVQGSGDAPWTDTTDGTATLVLHAAGNMMVPNPAYEGPTAPAPYNQQTVQRSYGFGPGGTVTLDGSTIPTPTWNNNLIQATIPACGAPPCEYQLEVTRGDNGRSTVHAVTVTVSTETPIRVPADYATIQEAIDAASPGDLILVSPGVYNELVVMWQPVRLQGAGAGSTIINAVKFPPGKVEAWRQKVEDLIADGFVDLLPGQPDQFNIIGGGAFARELGAGITVLANNDDTDSTGRSFAHHPSRIDGFTITGADGGGGIFVNGYGHNLEISNNHVTGNGGAVHGGIRIGHPFLPETAETPAPPFDYNMNVRIDHNAITRNGNIGADIGAGGGVSLCTGSTDYTVSRNYICGNFMLSDGAGIGHLGLSDGGRIEFNQILFNQSFNPSLNRSGGGILIAGEPPVPPVALTLGAGNVTIDANLIQGNQAGSGHGAGIRLQLANGTDAIPPISDPWEVSITNNMVANNVAGWSGGGISLQDATDVSIINNTVANNDTTATVGALIVGNTSTAQPAGISSEYHSLALAAALGTPGAFSDPALFNNIVWHNRAFFYDATLGSSHLEPVIAPASVGDCPVVTNYWDLGVLGEPLAAPVDKLHPTYSILTDITDYNGASNNVSGDPDFLNEYCNGARTLSTPGPMQVAAEVIEGGNFIDVRYGPLTQLWPPGPPYGAINPAGPWNYHIAYTSPAAGSGIDNTDVPDHDFDNEGRPQYTYVDIGADEVGPGTVSITEATGATLAGGTLDFGNRNGLVSSIVTLTVGGATPVTFGTLTVSNTIGTAYSKGADTCSTSTVNPGNTCSVTVNFNAPGGNPNTTLRTGTLTAPHDGAESPATLNLTGR